MLAEWKDAPKRPQRAHSSSRSRDDRGYSRYRSFCDGLGGECYSRLQGVLAWGKREKNEPKKSLFRPCAIPSALAHPTIAFKRLIYILAMQKN